jgi:hypothetical protein
MLIPWVGAVLVVLAGRPALLASIEGHGPDAAVLVLNALLKTLAPALTVFLALALVVQAMMAAAINRAVLRPRSRTWGYVRFGKDELRQLGLGLLLSATIFVGVLAAVLAALVIEMISAGLVFILTRDPSTAPIFASAAILAPIAALATMVYLSVRLSLCSALTFDRRGVDLVASWRLTEGRSAPLLAVHLIAVLLWVVILCLFALMAKGVGFLETTGSDPSAALTVAALRILAACTSIMSYPVIMAPSAGVYRALFGSDEATTG